MNKIIILFSFILGCNYATAANNAVDLNQVEKEGEVSPQFVFYNFVEDGKPSKTEFQLQKLPSFNPNPKGTHLIRVAMDNIAKGEGKVWVKLPFLNCESMSVFLTDSTGNELMQLQRSKESSGLVYLLEKLPPNTKFIVFKIRSSFALFFPIKFVETDKFFNSEKRESFLYSLYFGIIIIMSLYNLFVFFSTKSISYLYYTFYSFTFGMAQFCLVGFFNSLISSDFILSKQFVTVFSGASGIFGVLFFNSFLETKKYLKRTRKAFLIFLILYTAITLLGILKVLDPVFNLLNLAGIGVGLLFLYGSAYLSFKKNRPAQFYLVAWATFITGLVMYILTNVGVIPYNSFTQFLLPLGSAIEISLLSFALADKINILSQENETLVREQNVVLERQVNERTLELREANENLKQTQTQLVNSEKMASLGHLTAGIAHEINNPINFISANISPLRRDIEDYEMLMGMYGEVDEENIKEKLAEIQQTADDLDITYLKSEIKSLLNGIDEGAKRTSEIVKNLKIFSHIDKSEHSYYSINEGILSTLHLLSHKLSDIIVNKNFNDLPPILCYPGKLNQVFMNILSNAIDSFHGIGHPEITINSYANEEAIFIEFIDNGTGIPEAIQKDIFNPFFTTKEVGSGTGLGLSITLSIIQEHNGEIKLESKEGEGSKFIISIPLKF